MSLGQFFLVIAVIVMVLGSMPISSRVSLWNLGWAFVIAALIVGYSPLLIR